MVKVLLGIYAIGIVGGLVGRWAESDGFRAATAEVVANVALVVVWPILFPAWAFVRFAPKFTRQSEPMPFHVTGTARDLEGEVRWSLGRRDHVLFFGRGKAVRK